jgi:hypothetical protein
MTVRRRTEMLWSGKGVMSVKLVPAGGPRLTPLVDLVVLAAAVVLLLAGAALMLTDVLAASIAIPVITIGVALVAIARTDKRRRRP